MRPNVRGCFANDNRAAELVNDMGDLLRQSLDNSRTLASELSPAALEQGLPRH